jgi:putative membrane protein
VDERREYPAAAACRSAGLRLRAINKSNINININNRELVLNTVANLLIALVALLHVYFLVLEMFLWDKPFGRKTFKLTPEFASASKALAANQGLYNGFLAAGLAWGICLGEAGLSIKIFFLACVIVAGIFGAITVGRKILFIQALPAALALALLLAFR